MLPLTYTTTYTDDDIIRDAPIVGQQAVLANYRPFADNRYQLISTLVLADCCLHITKFTKSKRT